MTLHLTPPHTHPSFLWERCLDLWMNRQLTGTSYLSWSVFARLCNSHCQNDIFLPYLPHPQKWWYILCRRDYLLPIRSYFWVQKRCAYWSLISVHEWRDEVQPLMLVQKMSFIAASPAVILKIFSVGSIVCILTLCAGNVKGMLESIRMRYHCRDIPITSLLVQR